jgi:hypothetical protein
METIKPGTRCECSSIEHRHSSPLHSHELPCGRDAVRMVETRSVEPPTPTPCNEWTWVTEPEYLGYWMKRSPMCEPCASFHEAKAGAR